MVAMLRYVPFVLTFTRLLRFSLVYLFCTPFIYDLPIFILTLIHQPPGPPPSHMGYGAGYGEASYYHSPSPAIPAGLQSPPYDGYLSPPGPPPQAHVQGKV
ncbi:hypothetical protein F5890DRAFT_1510037 [Lentinula detonsa]|uniref:Uncharacterized protein n=1 Tax=Lentinula detonsa TaxID=2804962 RepID=A0AA38UV34_9AGAR|nr:hypothetical protein F5890DRAFT_1510037 [Lentinula detonsa]